MIVLALEFSSEQRSVAVARGGLVLAETSETGGRVTNALGMIEKVLAEAKLSREEIETIAVGLGPGSYTGIRAAIAVAQGWQLARGVKLLGVSSAAAIAAQAGATGISGKVDVVIDAQRGEFYLAGYEISAGEAREWEPLRIVQPEEVRARVAAGGRWVGPGMENQFPAGTVIFPRAERVAQLAGRLDFSQAEDALLEPVYLRETTFVKAFYR